MSKRKTITAPMVQSLEDADKVLAELAALERDACAIKNALNETIDQAKTVAAEKTAPLENRRKELENALASFAAINKNMLFKDRRSVELHFGSLNIRASTKVGFLVRGTKWEQVIEQLTDKGFLDGLRIKTEVAKDVLSTWENEKLALVGVKKTVTETFGYKLKAELPGLSPAQ